MKTARKKKSTASAPPAYPQVMEMFSDPYIQNHWKEPDCFNRIVHYRKYRVTVELVDEPEDVLRARLLKIWRECDNHHSWVPLRAAAEKYGLDLKSDDFGKDRKK